MKDDGTIDSDVPMLYKERVPKKDWTKDDKKQVKEVIRINHQFGPMLNKIFANAARLAQERKGH